MSSSAVPRTPVSAGSSVSGATTPGSSGKKLKQTRLPFSPVNKESASASVEVKTNSDLNPDLEVVALDDKPSEVDHEPEVVDLEGGIAKENVKKSERQELGSKESEEARDISVKRKRSEDDSDGDREIPTKVVVKEDVAGLCNRPHRSSTESDRRAEPPKHVVHKREAKSDSDSPTDADVTVAKKPKRAASVAKQVEMEKKKEERRLQKEEKDRLKEEARLMKEKKKEEEKEKRLQAKREKEAHKEAERLQKETLRKQKEEEREQERRAKAEAKQAEKEAKLAEQQKKMEEKEKKLEEKRKQEELLKLRQRKSAETFKSFFIQKAAPADDEQAVCGGDGSLTKANNNLNLFRVKKDMRLAPLSRAKDFGQERRDFLDTLISGDQSSVEVYTEALKNKSYTIGSSDKTWPLEELKANIEVEVVEDDEDEDAEVDGVSVEEAPATAIKRAAALRPKLLQFSENQRPPYWGTWSRRSRHIGPRRPFGRDIQLDYDYDSDDDWEEEEQGESLSDEEKDKEEEEEAGEEDDDDGFFVGHGVLDKDEMMQDEEDDMAYDEELELKKQRLRAQQFEEEYKRKKPIKLKPRVVGCVFVDGVQSGVVYEQLLKILAPLAAVKLNEDDEDKAIPTALSSPKPSPSVTGTPGAPSVSTSPSSEISKRGSFPENSMPDLVRLVHVNTHNKMFLAREFAEFLKQKVKKGSEESLPEERAGGASESSPHFRKGQVAKRKIVERILEIAEYKKFHEEGPMKGKMCWVVKPEVLEKHHCNSKDSTTSENLWEYKLERPKNRGAPLSSGPAEPTVGGSQTVADLRLPHSPSTTTPTVKKTSPEVQRPEVKKEKKRVSIQTIFLSMNSKMKKDQEQQGGGKETE